MTETPDTKFTRHQLLCHHEESLWGRCIDCNLTWGAQASDEYQAAKASAMAEKSRPEAREIHEAAEPEVPLPSDEEVAGFLAEVTGPHVQISEDLERLERRKRIDGRFHVPSVTEWIRIGDIVLVKDAAGDVLRKRATSPDLEDHVWLCDEDEWQAARERGREPEAVRWPIEDVVQAERPDPVEQEEVRDGDA